MKVYELIHKLTSSKVNINADIRYCDINDPEQTPKYVTAAEYDKETDIVYISNKYDLDRHPVWHSVKYSLPPYDKDVLVCLPNRHVCVTHRTQKDFSKDKYDFLHKSFVLDARYWLEIPEL